jgi:signal transduction histidine kinase
VAPILCGRVRFEEVTVARASSQVPPRHAEVGETRTTPARSLEMSPDPEVARRTRHEDLKRTERIMITVRWFAVVFAVVQVLAYSNMPAPDHVQPTGLALAGVLGLVNLLALWLTRRVGTYAATKALALGTLGTDIAVSAALVWLYAFDQESAMWAILFVVPLEGAVRFHLRGALGTWAAVTFLYTLRELWGSANYGYDFEWNSVSFRMGINLLIAMVAGFMAADLVRQRSNVETALAEVARVDTMRRHLVSTLAHDVRGPLTAIRGSLKVVSDRPGLDPAHRDRLMRMAESQAGRLEYLAADLLDLARLDEGRLDLSVQDLDLAEVVNRALQFVDVDGSFEVRVEPGTTVHADPRRLEQIVVNLTANALRHGAAPFEVRAHDQDGRVCLAVCDAGAGVPAQRRGTLFQSWQAGEDDSSGSVGLGLWIVRLLTEAQGGTVAYVRSGGESRFEVALPARSTGSGIAVADR